VTSQIVSLALDDTTAEVTVTLASGLGLMPLYNEDIDTPVPPGAVGALRPQVAAADAVLLISPSHNGSMSAALKNAIDWLSRPRGMAPLLGTHRRPHRRDVAASGPDPQCPCHRPADHGELVPRPRERGDLEPQPPVAPDHEERLLALFGMTGQGAVGELPSGRGRPPRRRPGRQQ
jgi:hypothetical protein